MSKSVYQFKITLEELEPEIWRLIEVPSDCTFQEFNEIILAAMGWNGDHLHEFRIHNPKTGHEDNITAEESLNEGWDDPEDFVFDHKVRLDEYFSESNRTAKHNYNFYVEWSHSIVFQKELVPEPGIKYPRCIDGERACPPEECGGSWGYENFMQIRKKPRPKLSSKERERMDWFGDFDPELFSVDEVNERFKDKTTEKV